MPSKREEHKHRLNLLNIFSWLEMLKRVNFFISLVTFPPILLNWPLSKYMKAFLCLDMAILKINNQEVLLTKNKPKEQLKTCEQAKG